MTVSDTLRMAHGKFIRERRYPLREKVLRENQESQRGNGVQATDGLRLAARFPAHEMERLAEKYPSQYAYLVCPDPKIQSRAINKLLNSSEGKKYRVGETSRKTFFFKNNPLARK